MKAGHDVKPLHLSQRRGYNIANVHTPFTALCQALEETCSPGDTSACISYGPTKTSISIRCHRSCLSQYCLILAGWMQSSGITVEHRACITSSSWLARRVGMFFSSCGFFAWTACGHGITTETRSSPPGLPLPPNPPS
jgi:hypothetical protein